MNVFLYLANRFVSGVMYNEEIMVKIPTGRTRLKLKYEGRIFPTKQYGDVLVVTYQTSNNILVRFLTTGYETTVTLSSLVNRAIKDPLQTTVHGVGVLGVGKYTPQTHPKHYTVWKQMLSRCYNEKYGRHIDYLNCSVSEEFKIFQTFAEWCSFQKGFNETKFELDKDLLCTGVKLYSRTTCVFVPNEINLLIRFPKKSIFYRGITRTPNNKYVAKLTKYGKKYHLGTFDTQEEAFCVYKQAKEAYVREVANKWRDQIDPRAYDALMTWEINIDD